MCECEGSAGFFYPLAPHFLLPVTDELTVKKGVDAWMGLGAILQLNDLTG